MLVPAAGGRLSLVAVNEECGRMRCGDTGGGAGIRAGRVSRGGGELRGAMRLGPLPPQGVCADQAITV